MKTANFVKTERLNIYPLSDSEMENLIIVELDAETKREYSEMLDGCKQNPEQRIWYAIWNMQLNDETGKSVGFYHSKDWILTDWLKLGMELKNSMKGRGI